MRTVCTSFPNVGLHLLIAIFCANVALSSQEQLDLLLGSAQDGWEFRGGHVGKPANCVDQHPSREVRIQPKTCD